MGGGGETVADSFKFWDSYMRALERVDDATAGRLVKALCREVFCDEQPDFSDEPMLGMVYDVMLGQATRSAEMAALGRKGGRNSGKSRARKSAGSDASKRNRSASKSASNVKISAEMKCNDISSLREEGAAYAGSGSRPPATPAPDPWDDPDYDGPIPYLGPDDSDGTDWA